MKRRTLPVGYDYAAPMKANARPEATLAKIAIWYGATAVVQSAALGGLLGTTMDFLFKDGLGLDAGAVARYGTIVGLPAYFAFLYGYARDRWGPKIGGDRTLIMAQAAAAILAYGLLALTKAAYLPILSATLALGFVGGFGAAGQNGAQAVFVRRRGIADRFSGFGLALGTVVSALFGLLGGWGAAHVRYSALLAASAAFGVVYLGLLLSAPKGVFAPSESPERREPAASLASQFASVLRSRPYLATLGLALVANFCPSSGSAFFFYTTNQLGAGAELQGDYRAIFSLAQFPVALLYGLYAHRTNLRNRMAIGVFVSVCGNVLNFALRTRSEFLPYAALVGISNTVFNAAFFDLQLSAVPKGSEGLGFALVGTLGMVVGQGSNLLGASVYGSHGYMATVWLALPASILAFAFLPLVPRLGSERPTG